MKINKKQEETYMQLETLRPKDEENKREKRGEGRQIISQRSVPEEGNLRTDEGGGRRGARLGGWKMECLCNEQRGRWRLRGRYCIVGVVGEWASFLFAVFAVSICRRWV